MEVAGIQPGTSTTRANHLTTVVENWITTYSWSSSSPSWPKSSARLSVHFRPAWPTKSCPLVSIGDQVKISISIALQNSSLANLLDRRMLLSGKAYASWQFPLGAELTSWPKGYGFKYRCVLSYSLHLLFVLFLFSIIRRLYLIRLLKEVHLYVWWEGYLTNIKAELCAAWDKRYSLRT